MTENETGYTQIGECRKCDPCEGEGSVTRYLPPAEPFYREEALEVSCYECNGSGQNRTDCAKVPDGGRIYSIAD